MLCKACFSPSLCVFHPIWVLLGGGGWHPRGLEHNLRMQFSNLGSSRMVVPLPSLRCLAEGNRIFPGDFLRNPGHFLLLGSAFSFCREVLVPVYCMSGSVVVLVRILKGIFFLVYLPSVSRVSQRMVLCTRCVPQRIFLRIRCVSHGLWFPRLCTRHQNLEVPKFYPPEPPPPPLYGAVAGKPEHHYTRKQLFVCTTAHTSDRYV